MITADQIKATKAYQELPPMLKKFAVSRNNIKNSIQHGVNLIENIGYAKWHAQTKVREYNMRIIDELIDLKHGKPKED